MNRIDKLFKEKNGNILSVYFTAGYPLLNSTVEIIEALSEAGADIIEIGIPFSDPMADGPVIQHSNEAALKNGMNLKLLFSQLKNIRNSINIPLLLMGYLNPVLQFGVEDFCRQCTDTGIDGVILPDLPPEVYLKDYKAIFEKYSLYNVLLISPQSDDERIMVIDNISSGFIYMVSSSSVTGARGGFSEEQVLYFKRVKKMRLKNPCLIGFGISDHETFKSAGLYSGGAIIGSAFIRLLGQEGDLAGNVHQFVKKIRG
jgi:tryptophan synthase alpha chain